MPDVPNLSILTAKKERPMEEIAPRHRLGRTIRNRRNVLERSLNEATAEVAKRLGSDDFTNVVLGEIERGVRPATMDELVAIAGALDIDLDILKKGAIEWHDSVWGKAPTYELHPGKTDAATIHALTHVEAMDELRGCIADMRRGAEDLQRAEDTMRKAKDFDLASEFKHTAELLGASVCRIEAKIGRRWGRAKFDFGQEEETD